MRAAGRGRRRRTQVPGASWTGDETWQRPALWGGWAGRQGSAFRRGTQSGLHGRTARSRLGVRHELERGLGRVHTAANPAKDSAPPRSEARGCPARARLLPRATAREGACPGGEEWVDEGRGACRQASHPSAIRSSGEARERHRAGSRVPAAPRWRRGEQPGRHRQAMRDQPGAGHPGAEPAQTAPARAQYPAGVVRLSEPPLHRTTTPACIHSPVSRSPDRCLREAVKTRCVGGDRRPILELVALYHRCEPGMTREDRLQVMARGASHRPSPDHGACRARAKPTSHPCPGHQCSPGPQRHPEVEIGTLRARSLSRLHADPASR
jgi:hypothetical protein